ENLFPSQLSINTRTDLEEERRLFYVAITRAEKKAFLTFAGSRYRWGNLTYSQPSRFIDEIDSEWLDKPEIKEQPNFDWDEPWDTDYSNAKVPKKNFPYKKKETPIKKAVVPSVPPKKNLVKLNTSSSNTGGSLDINFKVGDNVIHEKFGKG